MRLALLILLAVTLFDVGEMKMSSLSVSSGSSLKLPTTCTFDPSNTYELHGDRKMLGSYTKHGLICRLQFSKRLQFDQENCSFMLLNLTEEESNVYTFITRYQGKEKEKIVDQEEHFNVTVMGHITPVSSGNHSSQHREKDIYGSLAVCFLLDTLVAGLMMGTYQLLLWLVEKCRKRFSEEQPSCLHRVLEFILRGTVQDAANFGFAVGEYFSLAFQFIATILFIVWKCYGHGHSVAWPVCSGISFIVEAFIKFSRCRCNCLPKALRCYHRFVMLLRPLLINGSIVVAFSLIYHNMAVIQEMWFPVAALISLSIRVVLMLYFYWKQTNRNERNNDNVKTDQKLITVRPLESPPAQT